MFNRTRLFTQCLQYYTYGFEARKCGFWHVRVRKVRYASRASAENKPCQFVRLNRADSTFEEISETTKEKRQEKTPKIAAIRAK